MLTVNSCCCGCSLRVGSLLIAVAGLLGYTVLILLYALFYIDMDPGTWEFYAMCSRDCKGDAYNTCQDACMDLAVHAQPVSIAMTVVYTTQLLFHLHLLVGTLMEAPALLLAYCVGSCLAVLINLILPIFYLDYFGLSVAVLAVFLQIYFVIVVLSLCTTMGKGSGGAGNTMYPNPSQPQYPNYPQGSAPQFGPPTSRV